MGRIIILTGVLWLLAGVAVAGTCLEGDCQNGVGTYQWNDGAKFIGSFAVGDPDGEGIYIDSDGNEFHVTYQDGRPVSTSPVTKEEKERKTRHQEAERNNEAGLKCLRKNDMLSARDYFNKAITLWPENPEFRNNYRLSKGLK